MDSHFFVLGNHLIFGHYIFAKNSGKSVIAFSGLHNCRGEVFMEVIEASLELWFSNSPTAPCTPLTPPTQLRQRHLLPKNVRFLRKVPRRQRNIAYGMVWNESMMHTVLFHGRAMNR